MAPVRSSHLLALASWAVLIAGAMGADAPTASPSPAADKPLFSDAVYLGVGIGLGLGIPLFSCLCMLYILALWSGGYLRRVGLEHYMDKGNCFVIRLLGGPHQCPGWRLSLVRRLEGWFPHPRGCDPCAPPCAPRGNGPACCRPVMMTATYPQPQQAYYMYPVAGPSPFNSPCYLPASYVPGRL